MADIYDYIRELAKFELEFEDEDNVEHFLRSYIKRLEEDRMLIEPPSYKGVTRGIPADQMVRIMFSAKDGVYAGECKVIGKELSSISGLWLSYPLNSQHIQRREYLRVPLQLEANLVIFADTTRNKSKELKITTKDVSGKGFSFISNSPLKDYYDIECDIYLDDEIKKPIFAKCEHIYSKIHNKNKHEYINAVAFAEISIRDVERIVKASFKYQLEEKKRKLDLD